MLLTIGRIGRAHGVRGEVTVEVRTDFPEERFQVGSELQTEPKERGPLKIETARWNNGTLLLSFAGKIDRSAVEPLRNTELLAEVDTAEELGDDEFHITQILGCNVFIEGGELVGEIIDVLALPGADTLVILQAGREILVPFVKHHVPKIDIPNKRIELANIEGLL